MHLIGPKIQVPANSSRLFNTFEESKIQPTGLVQLATSQPKPFLFNASYSAVSTIYDNNYCTVDPFHFSQSIQYFEKLLPRLFGYSAFIEIGCGQGEFVKHLRSKGLNAFGFDPVLHTHTQYLVNDLWSINLEADLISQKEITNPIYIMRCVLPHIENPFGFLNIIFEHHPDGAVLLEFQRREWISDHKVWSQISHDHVNIFSERDFNDEFKVLNYGYFSNDEWVYILIKRRPSSADTTKIENQEFTEFSDVFFTREQEISTLVEHRKPIVIYGAAGKGIVLGYSLVKAGISDVFAVDADPNRQGLYMECSGVPVVGTNEVTKILSSDVLILVANPNHFSYVVNRFKHSLIKSIGNLMTL